MVINMDAVSIVVRVGYSIAARVEFVLGCSIRVKTQYLRVKWNKG